MNGLPPKITPGPSGASAPKPSKPLSSKHVALGIAGGFVAGALLASLCWGAVGLIFFTRARTAPAQFDTFTAPTLAPVPNGEASEASDKATIAEIDAAAQLSFEQNKLALFNQIAVRQNLGPAAQVHLVEMAFKQLSFEQNQMQVLSKIIANPAFSPDAKQKILEDLHRISFEANKQAILEAMNRRESQK